MSDNTENYKMFQALSRIRNTRPHDHATPPTADASTHQHACVHGFSTRTCTKSKWPSQCHSQPPPCFEPDTFRKRGLQTIAFGQSRQWASKLRGTFFEGQLVPALSSRLCIQRVELTSQDAMLQPRAKPSKPQHLI